MTTQLLQQALDALEGTDLGLHYAAIAALRSALAAPQPEPDNDDVLWLWRDGDHFLAFRHLYPCYSPGGDPMTLGEPFGKAIFRHSYDRAAAPPAAPQPEPWMPIESAPKDGRKIILTYRNANDKPRTVMAVWVTDEEAAENDEDGVGLEAGWYESIDNWDDYSQVAIHAGEPTHWMPLPAAPGATPPAAPAPVVPCEHRLAKYDITFTQGACQDCGAKWTASQGWSAAPVVPLTDAAQDYDWMPEARQAAAQCWCDPETSRTEMDATLAESIARRIAAWMQTGAFHARNEAYWRDRCEAAEAYHGIGGGGK